MADVGSPFFQGLFPETQGFMPGPGAYEPNHTGIDIGLPAGTPLLAPTGGTVEDLLNPGGFGTYQVFHPTSQPGVEYVLGHESSWNVPSGPVNAGTLLGFSGSSGWSTGPHLHLQENVNAPAAGFGGTPVDPSGILSADATLLSSTPYPIGLKPGPNGQPVPAGSDPLHGNPIGVVPGANPVSDAVSQALSPAVTQIGHGLADALGVGVTDVGLFFQRQIVALAVAAVVLLVLFNR